MINFILNFLIIFMIVRIVMTIIYVKKQKKQIQALREKYYEMTKEEAMALDDQELVQAASFRVSTRYSVLHGGLGVLNEEEKTLLTYDQMKISCTTQRASINTFFTDFTALIMYAGKVFDIIGEGKASYDEAYQLYLKNEAEYQKDIDEVIDELGSEVEEKSFVDYTNELKPVFTKPETNAKMASFIKTNIDQFFYPIKDEDDDEEISDFYDESDE